MGATFSVIESPILVSGHGDITKKAIFEESIQPRKLIGIHDIKQHHTLTNKSLEVLKEYQN